MLRKILGKKNKSDEEDSFDPQLVEKISKMNLTDMRLYVKSKEIDVDGLFLVLKRLIEPNDKGEYYIKSDDMDSKKKKAFDLVLLIAQSKKISSKVLEGINTFTEVYKELIKEYDHKHKEIYMDRFKKGFEAALINLQTLGYVHKKLDVLK